MTKSRVTVHLHDSVHGALKAEAAHKGKTLSAMAESALRYFLSSSRKRPKRRLKLPVFHSGDHLVDIDDRDALYRAMEE